jgi:hypothetical protein
MVKTYKAQQPKQGDNVQKVENVENVKHVDNVHSGLPVCPIHGATLQRFERDGRTWHSHKPADGTWCKGKGKTASGHSRGHFVTERISRYVSVTKCPPWRCLMMERVTYSTIPFPFDELPPEDKPMTDLDVVTTLKPMLRASFALARVTYCAALGADVSDEDVREALSVLSEYLLNPGEALTEAQRQTAERFALCGQVDAERQRLQRALGEQGAAREDDPR